MPRMSREEKARTHARIITVAARLFREQGIAATGVADVMKAAGLTHGGFFRHFGSKDELAAAAIDAAVDGFISTLEEDIGRRGPRKAVAHFVEQYLSAEHVAAPGEGCPFAALGEEAPRGPELCRQALSHGASRLIGVLEQGMTGDKVTARATALVATLVGTLVLARTATSEAAAGEFLAAGRVAANVYLGGGRSG